MFIIKSKINDSYFTGNFDNGKPKFVDDINKAITYDSKGDAKLTIRQLNLRNAEAVKF